MWACKTREDARLYAAVESCSNFAIELGSIFQQERLPFDETKYQMKKLRQEQLLFRQVETVPILEKW
jgi:hypothetical protein